MLHRQSNVFLFFNIINRNNSQKAYLSNALSFVRNASCYGRCCCYICQLSKITNTSKQNLHHQISRRKRALVSQQFEISLFTHIKFFASFSCTYMKVKKQTLVLGYVCREGCLTSGDASAGCMACMNGEACKSVKALT